MPPSHLIGEMWGHSSGAGTLLELCVATDAFQAGEKGKLSTNGLPEGPGSNPLAGEFACKAL